MTEHRTQINVTVTKINDGVIARFNTSYPDSGDASVESTDMAATNIGEVFDKLDFMLEEIEGAYFSLDYDPRTKRIYLDEDIANLNEHGLRVLQEEAERSINN